MTPGTFLKNLYPMSSVLFHLSNIPITSDKKLIKHFLSQVCEEHLTGLSEILLFNVLLPQFCVQKPGKENIPGVLRKIYQECFNKHRS